MPPQPGYFGTAWRAMRKTGVGPGQSLPSTASVARSLCVALIALAMGAPNWHGPRRFLLDG
jgi:hypothetical protein